jgi:hypothetical protein
MRKLLFAVLLVCGVVVSGCGTTPTPTTGYPVQETRHLSWSDKKTVFTLEFRTYEAELKDNTMTLTVDGHRVNKLQEWCDIGQQHHKVVASVTRGWDVNARMGEDKTMYLSVGGIVVVTRITWCVEIVEYV